MHPPETADPSVNREGARLRSRVKESAAGMRLSSFLIFHIRVPRKVPRVWETRGHQTVQTSCCLNVMLRLIGTMTAI